MSSDHWYRNSLLVLFLLPVFLFTVAQDTGPFNAIALVISSENGINGSVLFAQVDIWSPVTMNVHITGLKDGNHGFHIHDAGDLSAGCGSTGGHYNPYGNSHGGFNDTNRHLGDFGNIYSSNSVADMTFNDSRISLSTRNNVLGRAVVVHENEDDLGKGSGNSSTTGNAGNRLACGIIGHRLVSP